MNRHAITFCLLAASATAHATPTVSHRMCGTGNFFPAAFGCDDTSGFYDIEANYFDSPVHVWAASGTPRGKLVVFFHGHGGTPDAALDFGDFASSLGFDVISLDYDYSRDYTPSTVFGYSPSDANCTFTDDNGDCNMGLAQMCGCYADCYGYRWKSVWKGINHAGLPSVTADWTIDSRLQHVIAWMSVPQNSGAWFRFAGYLDQAQLGGINWNAIDLAGHSQGASVVGYIGKWQHVDRVIVMSGIGDSLAPHTQNEVTSSSFTWGDAYGCNTCTGTDDTGGTLVFSNCTCNHTMFAYGTANNLGNCTLTTSPVGWVSDGGAQWATAISSYYGFEDTNDTTCNWFAPSGHIVMTQRNWKTLGFQKQHASGFGDGFDRIGGAGTGWDVLSAGRYHGILVANGTSSSDAAQICNKNGTSGHDGHLATIENNVCDNNSLDLVNRQTAWQFMLTN